ncbi:hypothetical protein B0H16DRAFT_1701190 [Mycena metata]|uniref:Uncharacterized protein n=1 Tax=Mycena metata TaxID=1033252 RepID=A0AAD7HBR1_9AGAR|nr:hypothetical protein B0H16DRAFT_1701190 [Mycena metata]
MISGSKVAGVRRQIKYQRRPPMSVQVQARLSEPTRMLNSLVVDPNHLRTHPKLQAASNPKTCVSVPTRASSHPIAVRALHVRVPSATHLISSSRARGSMQRGTSYLRVFVDGHIPWSGVNIASIVGG